MEEPVAITREQIDEALPTFDDVSLAIARYGAHVIHSSYHELTYTGDHCFCPISCKALLIDEDPSLRPGELVRIYTEHYAPYGLEIDMVFTRFFDQPNREIQYTEFPVTHVLTQEDCAYIAAYAKRLRKEIEAAGWISTNTISLLM